MIYLSGKTVDGKLVIGGIYSFYESYGVPFDIIFQYLKDNQSIPDWQELYFSALKAGINHDRLLSKLSDPIIDVFGLEMEKNVILMLEIERVRKLPPEKLDAHMDYIQGDVAEAIQFLENRKRSKV